MYYQMADGLLAGPVGTFENGDAGIDFEGNQGSIQVSGDQVFVANGAINPATGARGEGSVSVFTFTKHGLTRTDNVPSGGPNPASFALCDNILYVANAALLGGFVGFIAAHPTISSTITALKVEDDGTLTYIEELTQDLGVGARPVDVQITPDKKYLVIPMSAAGEMRAYEVGNDCMLTGNFVSTTEGLLGPVAFSTAVWGGKNYVYVGNAGSGTVSAFVLDEENETLSFINSEVGPGEGAALCWTVIYGTYVYTANALTGTISSFEIDPADGSVKLLSEVAAVTGDLTIPQDMYIQNGKLYQLLGGNGNILVYDIDGGDGSLSLLQTFDADLPGSTTHRPGGLAAGYFDAPEYVQVVGNNGQPSSAFPLGKCQGDCDVDEECDGELVCFHRDGSDPVPGCLGGEEDRSRTDYCVSA
jgi:6-phosphogluconolactonase (cycloisomerase 2 family)